MVNRYQEKMCPKSRTKNLNIVLLLLTISMQNMSTTISLKFHDFKLEFARTSDRGSL
jgi:hypothetical protein